MSDPLWDASWQDQGSRKSHGWFGPGLSWKMAGPVQPIALFLPGHCGSPVNRVGILNLRTTPLAYLCWFLHQFKFTTVLHSNLQPIGITGEHIFTEIFSSLNGAFFSCPFSTQSSILVLFSQKISSFAG